MLYPDGFPKEVIGPFRKAIGREVLGNRPASGTAIIEDLGAEHLRTGAPIVYTSGDSVFQVAAHVDVVPLETLYAWCARARKILHGPHRVGRVIARPFEGEPGSFTRTPDRRDYAVEPPGRTACDLLHEAGIPVKGVGKIEDLFASGGVTWSAHTGTNQASMDALGSFLDEDGPAFVFANLVDFDQLYGHRNDPIGYARCLEEFDAGLAAEIVPRLREADRIMITGDHGTDPTITASTDHTRERVPLVAAGPQVSGVDLGVREMIDVGTTVLDLFGVTGRPGTPRRSFADVL
jgi:phosphopentomutase